MAKRRRYAGYYDVFRPFVISLTDAVTEEAFGAIKKIAKAAAAAYGPRLDWEPYRWAVLILACVSAWDGECARVRPSWLVRVQRRSVCPSPVWLLPDS